MKTSTTSRINEQDRSTNLSNFLAIFDKESQDYLQINKIQQWMAQSEGILQDLPSKDLIKIFVGAADLAIFDTKFIKNLCKAIIIKLSDFSYLDLSTILYSLQSMKYNKDILFIKSIVTKLTQIEEYDSIKSLSNTIWSLSKLEFHDEEFFDKWIKLATPAIKRFNESDLIKSIQAIASLKFVNEEFINLWIDQYSSITNKFNPRAQLNIAFYLSEISINSFDNSQNLLKSTIDNLIKDIISNIDINFFQDNIAKQQILQIYLSKICAFDEEVAGKLRDNIQEQSHITISIIQKRVESFIKKVYPKFKVISEYYDSKTSSYVDLIVVRDPNHPDLNVHIQIDGPTHYFINRQPRDNNPLFNAATEFRNRLHELNSFKPYVISYVNIDNGDYYENLLERLNTYPEGYLRPENALKISASDAGSTPKRKISGNTKKTNKKINKKAAFDEEFDAIVSDFQLSNQDYEEKELSPEEKHREAKQKYSNGKKSASLKTILHKAISQRDLESIENILQYEKSLKTPEEFNMLFSISQDHENDLFEFSLSKISADHKTSKTYIEICSLFLGYGYKIKYPNSDHLKALLYAFRSGDVGLFQNFLKLIPASDNKLQLMKYFFILCGTLNHVEIASFLLNNNIDINSCYSKKSVEFFGALANGGKIHASYLPNIIDMTITNLHKILIDFNTAISIENLLQELVGEHAKQDDNTLEGRGVTALYLSCFYGKEKDAIRLFLLNNDANPNIGSPLFASLAQRNEVVALQILDFHPNVNLRTLSDITVAHIAAKHGFRSVLKKIIDLHGNVDIKTTAKQDLLTSKTESITFTADQSPLTIALEHGYISIVEDLILAGVDINKQVLYVSGIPCASKEENIRKPMIKCSPLVYSIKHHPELVDKLLENGAQVNEKYGQVNILMLVAELSNPETVRRIAIELKKPNPQDYYQQATKFKEFKFFEKLLLRGADINFKDPDGNTVEKYTLSESRVTDHANITFKIIAYEKIFGISIEYRKKVLSDMGICINKLNIEEANISPYKMIADARAESEIKYDTKDILIATNYGIQAGKTILGAAKTYLEPTLDNLRKTSTELNYLAGIYYGNNIYSMSASACNLILDLSHGNFEKAITEGLTSFTFMALHYAYLYSTPPHITATGFAAIFTILKGYSLYEELNQFIQEYNSEKQQLKSAQAYSELYHYLSATPLQNLFDFDSLASKIDMKLIVDDLLI